MVKVSRNPLSPEVKREVTEALVNIVSEINDRAFLRKFIDDLLTPTEKMMLSKRLMAAVLLQRGYSHGAVCSALKMSRATVSVIQRELLRGGEGYRAVFQKFFQESRGHRIVGAIEQFLDAITLPVKGSPSSMRRWKRSLRRL